MRKGQKGLTVSVTLPPDIHPGEWKYRVWADVRCNLFHRGEEPFEDVSFIVFWGDKTKAAQQSLLGSMETK